MWHCHCMDRQNAPCRRRVRRCRLRCTSAGKCMKGNRHRFPPALTSKCPPFRGGCRTNRCRRMLRHSRRYPHKTRFGILHHFRTPHHCISCNGGHHSPHPFLRRSVRHRRSSCMCRRRIYRSRNPRPAHTNIHPRILRNQARRSRCRSRPRSCRRPYSSRTQSLRNKCRRESSRGSRCRRRNHRRRYSISSRHRTGSPASRACYA